MFILEDLNIYLVQNKGATAACLMAIFSAKKGEIDVCIYSNSLPHKHTHSKSEKEEDIKSPPPKKLQKNTNKTKQKTKSSKLGMSPFPNFLFLFSVGTLFLSPLYLSSW